jgi:CRP-like cAMP-binding protein
MAVDRAAVDPGQLRELPLYADLGPEELGRAAELTEWIEISARETIGAERNFAYEFFVIEEGQAEVVRDGRRLAELGPGDFFGEIGLLVTGRRTASVVALTPMRLMVMFEQSFRRLEREFPAFAAAVRAACAERFQRA